MHTDLKLAITKIGDLLLRDKITQDTGGKAISNINLVIPNYQRPYKWESKDVIQLLDDILEAKNANKEIYRVGTLILHQEDKRTYNIVDGQQRTITFSLLLKALDSDSAIRFLEQPLADNKDNRHNVPNNFRTLKRRLERRVNNNADEKDNEGLFNYIKNNCELIVVITADISEAFQFFDSQNVRGKKLYPHDLLKAYHLREMNYMYDMNAAEIERRTAEIERTVKVWEDLDQEELSALFSEYLYRVKEWTKGNKADELTEHNIHKFKGVSRQKNYPYAQFYAGTRTPNVFQLDVPIIAGKRFFDYAKHYFDILKSIRNNDKNGKNEGRYIKENEIVQTLDLDKYKNGTGNLITRLLFDTAILLYVDRFCPQKPAKKDSDILNQFVEFAFIWAYSLRAQYTNLGWPSAQNYIMGNDVINSFNIYKVITEADSPEALLSILSDTLMPLPKSSIEQKYKKNIDKPDKDNTYQNFLHYFKEYKFYGGRQ